MVFPSTWWSSTVTSGDGTTVRCTRSYKRSRSFFGSSPSSPVTVSSSGSIPKTMMPPSPVANWRYRASLNGLGAAVTAVATAVFLATKFTEGAWAVVLALPAFIMLFTRIHRYYDQAGRALGIGGIPGKPQARPTAVVVPVTGCRGSPSTGFR